MRLLSVLAVTMVVGCASAPPLATPPPTTVPSAPAPDPELDRLLSRPSGPPPNVPDRSEVVRIADAPPAGRYHGRPIDLDVKSAEVVEVLRLLADVGHVNLVVADDVKGTITLRLRQVPWDQALEVVAKAKGLGLERDGNVMTVGSVVYPPAH